MDMDKLYKLVFLFLLINLSIAIVILPFVNKETFFKNEPLVEDDAIIFKDKSLYNLGDLLLIPKTYNAYTEQTEHVGYRPAIADYPESIVALYESLRESPDEYIPNFDKIRKSVDMFIDNNKTNADFMNKLKFISNSKVLCVHLRTGDLGSITEDFKTIILKLSQEYEHVVICCGIHLQEGKNNLFSVNSFFNEDIIFKNIMISIEDPDVHMAMFRSCKNLLLSKTGFTILAGLIFKGNKLYMNPDTLNTHYNIYNTEIWKRNVVEKDKRSFKELIIV